MAVPGRNPLIGQGAARSRGRVRTSKRDRPYPAPAFDWLAAARGVERKWLLEEEHAIHFATTKTGAQRRVIGKTAVQLLLEQPDTGSKYFFPADWGEGHFIGVVRVLERVCARAELEKVTPHVLRHTFASVAGGLGYSELTIAALLGHASRGITQRYIHIDEPLRAAATSVSDHIAGLLDGKV